MKVVFKKIWSSICEPFRMALIWCQLRFDALRLDLAIFMANALQRAKNKRFYVIENARHQLIWICNDDIKEMQRPKYVNRLEGGKLRRYKVRMLPKGTGHLEVMRDCLYYTPLDRNNANGITVEERNKKAERWLSYMERVRMDRMFGKLRAKK